MDPRIAGIGHAIARQDTPPEIEQLESILIMARLTDKPIGGSRGWTRIVARARRDKVPGAEKATQVALAIALEGSGTVWFDDLAFAVAPPGAPEAGSPPRP